MPHFFFYYIFKKNSEYSYNIEDEIAENSGDDDEEFEEAELENEQNQAYKKFSNSIQMLESDRGYETLESNFIVSKAEILSGFLTYFKHFSISTYGIAHLFKLFNSFFNQNILPDSRYFIDKYFFPEKGMEYHAVCFNYEIYNGKFLRKYKTIICNTWSNEIHLKNLSYRDFFVTFDIEPEFRNIIENNVEY